MQRPANSSRIVLAGGSGFMGQALAREFRAQGVDTVILTRSPGPAKDGIRETAWDGRTLGKWAGEIDGALAVVNLAGKSVNCRYTPENRRIITDSRVLSTRAIGEAIANAKRPPKVWLQMSTATIYAHRYDAPNDEATGILGGAEASAPETWKFSIDVATAWERTANEARTPQTRKVLVRSAIFMGPAPGGVFDILSRLVRLRLGGRNGDGRQFVSWIHERDFVRAMRWLIERDDLDGPINLAAPNPLPNAEFMRALREAWGVRLGLPAARWMLEIGTFFLRTETELILKSRRVVPARLLQSGFSFEFPAWPEASRDLCRRWWEARSSY